MNTLLTLALLCHAAPALRSAELADDGSKAPQNASRADVVERAWPFCPTDRIPCGGRKNAPAWVAIGASVDVYSVRVRDPHSSIEEIIARTREDFAPLVEALKTHFQTQSATSDQAKVAFVQGLVQAVTYAFDDETGWTDYPKFGLEFFVDQQGDCDDAAIAVAILLEGIGYDAHFVLWRPLDPNVATGHLSAAVSLKGDLGSTTLPPDSLWVEANGTKYLHVDATGTPTGCKSGCVPLGWNEWHSGQTGQPKLKVTTVVETTDKDLAEKLPISAWNNGGREVPNRKVIDRRGSRDDTIADDLKTKNRPEDKTRERQLRKMGLDEDEAQKYLSGNIRMVDDVTYYVLSAAAGTFLFAFAAIGLKRRNDRHKLSQKVKSERESNKF